jgi:hypothetical protein
MYGLSDLQDSNPSDVLSSTIQQAQDKIGMAGLMAIWILLLVGFVIYRPGRR